VRLADGIPLSFDETYLRWRSARKSSPQPESRAYLFRFLNAKYNVALIEAEYKLDAVAAETDVAAALKVRREARSFD